MSMFGAPFVTEVDGKPVEFPLYTLADYEGLQNHCRAAISKQNRVLADEQGLTGLDRARFLQQVDPRSISLYDLDVFLSDDVQARKVLSVSLGKSGLSPDDARKIIERIEPAGRAAVAKHIVGIISLVPVPKPVQTEDEPVAPPT